MHRTFRIATPALAALAALTFAACSDVPATAPEQDVDLSASYARDPVRQTVTVTLAVRETPSAALIGGTTVAFKSGANGTPVNVADNSADDADKRSGYYQVTLSRSSVYEATVIAALSKYDRLAATKQLASASSTVGMGNMFLPVNPQFSIYVFRSQPFTLLGGATYSVGWADGSAPFMQRTDNVDDISGLVGVIRFYGKSAKTHQFCEIKAPAGFAIPTPSCKTAFASWGQTAVVSFSH